MRAKDVMTTRVVTVSPETTIADAARMMLDNRISGVPVVDQQNKLVGILTEGDLMRRAELVTTQRPWWLALMSSPEQRADAYVKAHGLAVKDTMTRDVVTADEHNSLYQLAMLFEERGIKRAPVIRDGKIIGIVSRANVLQGLASSKAGDTTGPGDSEIRSGILSVAQREAGVRAPLVDITVANGVAHLWGQVGSDAERKAICVVAENAEGVREVQDHLRVLPRSVVALEPE